jgi:hypothetical protein
MSGIATVLLARRWAGVGHGAAAWFDGLTMADHRYSRGKGEGARARD